MRYTNFLFSKQIVFVCLVSFLYFLFFPQEDNLAGSDHRILKYQISKLPEPEGKQETPLPALAFLTSLGDRVKQANLRFFTFTFLRDFSD